MRTWWGEISEAPEPAVLDHVTTSSGSCEAGEDEKGPGLLVRDFTPPEGFNLVQHSKLETLYLQEGRHVKMLHWPEMWSILHDGGWSTL